MIRYIEMTMMFTETAKYIFRGVMLFLMLLNEVKAEVHFPDQNHVTPEQLITQLELLATEISSNSTLISEYQHFIKTQKLSEDALPYLDFVKVRMIFEATRDGGLWHLRWCRGPPCHRALSDRETQGY